MKCNSMFLQNTMSFVRRGQRPVVSAFVTVCLFGQLQHLFAQDRTIQVSQVTISLLREAELPARDAGTIASIEYSEGKSVRQNEIVAVLENNEQTLQLKASELASKVSTIKAEDELPLKTASAQLRESQSSKTVKEVSLKIAEAEATNESAVGIAIAETQLRQHELERAENAKSSFSPSISKSQIERLKTNVQKGQLEIQQAREALAIQKMKPEAEQAALNQKLEEISRYQTLLEQEQKSLLIAEFNDQLQKNAVEMARLKLEHRNIRAPFDGYIAKVERHVGEWVEPGSAVARIIDLNTLKAEGFLSAEQGAEDLDGRDVRISVSSGGKIFEVKGKVSFVSREVDPVNQQVRFWAEFDNSVVKLRPGMTGSLQILE